MDGMCRIESLRNPQSPSWNRRASLPVPNPAMFAARGIANNAVSHRLRDLQKHFPTFAFRPSIVSDHPGYHSRDENQFHGRDSEGHAGTVASRMKRDYNLADMNQPLQP